MPASLRKKAWKRYQKGSFLLVGFSAAFRDQKALPHRAYATLPSCNDAAQKRTLFRWSKYSLLSAGDRMNDPKKHASLKLSREELHERVWQIERQTLASELGITQRRLVEICNQLAVPYPQRRYWQRVKAGKPVLTLNLPELPSNAPRFVIIEPSEKTAPRGTLGWHPLIETWRRQRSEARSKYSQLHPAPDWSPSELRILKILNTIFREVEKHGFKPIDSRQWRQFSFRYHTVEISCSVREKNRRLREQRGPTEETVLSLKPTGDFTFRIGSYLGEASSIRREWIDKPSKHLEEMVPDIVSALLEAGPVLLLREQEERERLRRHFKDKELKEHEDKRLRIDRNRWVALVEYAQRLLIVDQVEKFLSLLENRTEEPSTTVDGQAISDWLQWARSRLKTFDPRSLSSQQIFADIARRGDEARITDGGPAISFERS